ncbi:hypothetical protein, partial [Aminivibrio sp.]|uniref:hypothetical protein n=1 Tax=Aminivibrio sp. TaxID=1872489 RepID=UPI00345E74DD
MAGITAFDIIGELKSLEEKGIIDSGVRKKWGAKVVNEGVTEEIIEQMASFKMREMEIRQEEQIRDAEKTRAVESFGAEPHTTESNTPEIQTEPEPETISTSATVSDIITELRRLVENGVIHSRIGKKWESKAVKEGVTEEIIAQITAFRKRDMEVRKEADLITKSKTGLGSGLPSGNTNTEGTASSISIIALVLGVMGLFVPFIAGIFIVPVALALGCVSVHKKEKYGKVTVVLALIGIVGLVVVSSELMTIFKDPFAPNFLTSSSSESQLVTMSEYNQIYDGMTYGDVVRIIGSRGEELSRSSTAGYTITMYAWSNKNGSNMTAMFENGKLTTKS